jgi:hypothetical protein
MKKINKSDVVLLIVILLIIILFLDDNVYNNLVKKPFNSPSPRVSGKFFYLLLYKIDQAIGKIGIILFFGIFEIYYLYKILKVLLKK